MEKALNKNFDNLCDKNPETEYDIPCAGPNSIM